GGRFVFPGADRDGLLELFERGHGILLRVFFLRAHVDLQGAMRSSRRTIFFSWLRASNVALTTFPGLVVPSDFVRMLATPTDSSTARTGPPAITPVPSAAGFNST